MKEKTTKDEFFKIDRGRARLNLCSELWVGGGNTTFRANREGVFAGANNYTTAPFKISYADGSVYSGSSSGSALKLDNGTLRFYYGGSSKASIGADSSSSIVYSSNDNHYFRDNTKELGRFNGDGLLLPSSKSIFFSSGVEIRDEGSNLYVDRAFEIGGTFYPRLDNTYELGSSSKRWKNGWFEDLSVDDITINSGGSITVAGNSGDDEEFEVATSFNRTGSDYTNYEYQWKGRLLTFKKGILTNKGSESDWRTMT